MVISVPSPSTVMPPPSRTMGAANRSTPKCPASRSPMAASFSYGTYFSPQELNVKSLIASVPSGCVTKIGPLSRSQESSMGSSTTSTSRPR